MKAVESPDRHGPERQDQDGRVVMQHIDTLRRAEQERITSFRLAHDLGLTAAQAEDLISSLILRGLLAPAGSGQRLEVTPKGEEWLRHGSGAAPFADR